MPTTSANLELILSVRDLATGALQQFIGQIQAIAATSTSAAAAATTAATTAASTSAAAITSAAETAAAASTAASTAATTAASTSAAAITSANGAWSDMLSSVALKYGLIAMAARKAFQTIERMIRPAIAAVNDYQSFVIQTAANLTNMKGPSANGGDISRSYAESKAYAEALALKMDEVDAHTIASAKDLRVMTEEMAKQGVFLDINNQKEVEGFTNLANAVKVISQGYGASEIQIRQEIRALMEGQVNQYSQLASQINAISGGKLKEQVELWKQQGTLIEHVGSLLVGYAAAVGDINSLWTTVSSTMSTISDRILRNGFEPSLRVIVGVMQDISGYLKEHEGALESGIHKSLTVILSILETCWDLLKPFTPLLAEMLKPVIKMADGWGLIVSTLLPEFTTLIKNLISPVTDLAMVVVNLAKVMGTLGTMDMGTIQASVKTLGDSIVQTGRDTKALFTFDYMGDFEKRANDYLQTYKIGASGAATPKLPKHYTDGQLKNMAKAGDGETDSWQQQAQDYYAVQSRALGAPDDIAKWDAKHSRASGSAAASQREAARAAEEYAKALSSLEDIYSQLTQSEGDNARFDAAKWYKEQSAVLGQNNQMLNEAYESKLKNIAADEDAKRMELSGGNPLANSMQIMQQVTDDRLKTQEDLTAKINKLTLNEHDYKLWALDDEVEKMRAAAVKSGANTQEIMAQISQYYELQHQQITSQSNYMVKLSENTANAIENAFSSFFFDAFTGKLNSLNSLFQEFANSIMKSLSSIMGNQLIQALLGKSSGGNSVNFSGGIFSNLINSFFPSSAAASGTAASASAGASSSVISDYTGTILGLGFHSGGIVGQDMATFTQHVPASLFMGAPRFHDGLYPDEFPAILQRGEAVIPKSAVGSAASQSPAHPNVTVNVHNNTGNPAAVQQQDVKWNGQEMVVSLWMDAVARNVNGVRDFMGR